MPRLHTNKIKFKKESSTSQLANDSTEPTRGKQAQKQREDPQKNIVRVEKPAPSNMLNQRKDGEEARQYVVEKGLEVLQLSAHLFQKLRRQEKSRKESLWK